jgi:3-hydroxy acid dehydrogenase / malonic semialdehyde reductase
MNSQTANHSELETLNNSAVAQIENQINDISVALQPSISLKKKTALITGASSGIGLATAVALAQDGVHTILVARRHAHLLEIQSIFAKRGLPSCEIVCADVCSQTGRDAIQSAISKNPLDIFVNNAGLALGLDSVETAKSEHWVSMINTNITAAFLLTQQVVQKMKLQNSGHIVHIGSIAARTPYENGSVYTATKHALRAFSESLRQELCATNIKNSFVSPGMVETEFSKVRFGNNLERAGKVYEGMKPLTSANIASAILTCLKQEPNVSFDDLLIMPQAQGGMFKVSRR